MPSTRPAPELIPYLPTSLGASPVDEQRRFLLKASATALGLSFGGPLLAAADSVPSVLEAGTAPARALDVAEERIYAVGLGHMRPDTDPDTMHGQAAAVFRDVFTLRTRTPKREGGQLPRHNAGRALYLEALALAAIGSIYGHTRHWQLARPAFAQAKQAAARAAELGETRAPGATMAADALMAKVLLYMYPDQRRTALQVAQHAAGEATHPHLGGGPPPGSALALSLVARGFAAAGDKASAHKALDETARLMDRPGYFAAPFLSDVVPVDGPMSLFGYGWRAHLFTEAEVYAGTGDHAACEAAVSGYLAAPDRPSTTSAAHVKLLGPQCLIAQGRLDEAAEQAHAIIEGVPASVRNPAIIARGADLVDKMRRALESESIVPGPVDRYSAFISRQLAPSFAALVV